MELQASIIWEIARNVCFIDRTTYPQETQYSADDFQTLIAANTADWKGLNWAERITFLQQNGYAITHDNLIDGSLPSQPDQNQDSDTYTRTAASLPAEYWDLYDSVQQQLAALNEVVYSVIQDPTQADALVADAVSSVSQKLARP